MALSSDEIRRQLHGDTGRTLPTRNNENARERPKRGARNPTAGSSLPEMHRVLPNSVEAEQGMLGSMIISPRDAIPEVVAHLTVEYLYYPAHQTIFNVLVDEWDKGQAIDLIVFTQRLRDLGQLETVGGPSFITSLFTMVPTAANLEYYMEIVRDKYLLRQMIAAGTETVRRAFDEQQDVSGLVDEVEQKFIGLGDDRFKSTSVAMKDVVLEALDAIEVCYNSRGAVTGIATGFAELDRLTSGLQKTDMIVIAARPSMGKTALAMNIAEHVSLDLGKPVGVFSLEMARLQLVQRMLCSRARVNMQKVRDGFLAERDFPSLTAAASKLAEAKLHIDDSAALPILELRARARRMAAQFHIELLIVDYLQLLRSGSKRAQENRQVEISEISSGLKSLAKELKIPVVVLAQLNRQPEGRPGGRPRLSDLRESGSIEQDADMVGLLVRPEVYETDEDRKLELKGEAELVIAKNRNGPTGECLMTFLQEFTRFEDRARSVDYHLDPR